MANSFLFGWLLFLFMSCFCLGVLRRGFTVKPKLPSNF